jgi:hypothetical protein
MAVAVAQGPGAAITVIAIDAVTPPSTVAEIVLVPTATPVTVPLDVTVAMVGALELHVTVRFASTLPVAS